VIGAVTAFSACTNTRVAVAGGFFVLPNVDSDRTP
jgi:hypothetical protein